MSVPAMGEGVGEVVGAGDLASVGDGVGSADQDQDEHQDQNHEPG